MLPTFWLLMLTVAFASCASVPERSGGCSNPISSKDFFGDPPLEMSGGLAKAFSDAGEPSLACDAAGMTIWRFSYPGYTKPNVIIRATSDGRTHRIHVVRLTTSESGMNFHVVSRTVRSLTASEWAEIEAAADAADFWNRPRFLDSDRTGDLIVFHLQARVLEKRAQAHHLVEVYDNSTLMKLENTLKRLAGTD